MEVARVQFKLNYAHGAKPQKPTRAYEGDAGFDLYASREIIIPAGGFADVHTDIAIALPPHLWCRVVSRSSTSRRHGLLVAEGIIDTGYRGEMFFGVWNMNREDFRVDVGDRLAQLILMQHVAPVEWEEVDTLPPSERGNRGFGSSG